MGEPVSVSEPDKPVSSTGPHRRLAAIMFADMVGYSRRMEQDEARNASQAARSIELFRSLIGNYGGAVANVSGDGVLALFDSAEQGLRFATQIQNEFRDQAVWSDGAPIQFRIGLHLGEVVVRQGNVQGHSVNVAARLQALAEPGAILMTSAVRAAVRDLSGMSARALGYQSLKNISEPIEVFSVDPSGAPAPRSAEAARTVLPPEPSRQPSIAVLALANLSGDPASDHLGEGMAEDVIANLSRFRSLMVIARHSAFLFSLRTHAAREIGTRLGVRYLLDGSLRRAGKRMRIAVELIDVESERVLWSDRFNSDIEDLFDLQDEITGAVASRLAVQIDFAERHQEAFHVRDMRAYGLVLRGRQLIASHTKEANAHGRRLCEEAAEIAPRYGRAYSVMSRTHNLDWRYSWSPSPDQSLNSALKLAHRAIQLDRLDAHGFAELGFASLYKKQHDEALAAYARALALNPNDADILAEYADSLVYAGEPTKSIALLERAMRLNPYYPDSYLWCLADAYNALGRSADVVATVQRMQNPAEGERLLTANYSHLGLVDEARGHASEVMRLHPDFTISRWRDRPPYRDKAVLERYIDGLRRAGLPD
jgi:TolB-like protein